MVNANLQRGVKFLASQQLADGSFMGDSSPSATKWRAAYNYQTGFGMSLILNCLADIPATSSLRQKLSNLLLAQKSPSWSFNYWRHGSAELIKFPYPDDLDDTFCALTGLYRHDTKLITAEGLAKMTHLLLTNEETVGGPYRTWLATDWHNIDLAVNANIAYFLSLIGSPSPALLDFLQSRIKAGNYDSDFYPTPFPVWYYLARVCPPQCQKQLKQAILPAKPPNALQTALALSALRHLKADSQQITMLSQQLIEQQAPDGSWPAAAFCLDPSRDGKKYYHGSAALTTAFVLEALNGLDKSAIKPKPTVNKSAIALQKLILRRAQADLALLAPELSNSAIAMLQKILAADSNHKITLLPFYFGQSLAEPPTLTTTFYTRLGLANLYGWLAYTIYDDFIDEAGSPPLLPVANWAMRQSLGYFQKALPKHYAFQERVSQTFTVIDEANAWEIAHCRSPDPLPDYKKLSKLAERSLGHGLTPLAILIEVGYSLNSQEVIAVQQAMHHYLIARQLDDDAHDWQEDFAKNHISYVVAQIRLGLGHRQPTLPQMQQEFWHQTLPKICSTIQDNLQLARAELTSCSALPADNYLTSLLDGIEASVQSTLTKQTEAITFLKAYRGKNTK